MICKRCQQNEAVKHDLCGRCAAEEDADRREAQIALNAEREAEKERRRQQLKNKNKHRRPE